jgi:hypothetical protein
MTRATPDSHSPEQNHLLDALPAAERRQIYPHLQLVEMPLGTVVHDTVDQQLCRWLVLSLDACRPTN